MNTHLLTKHFSKVGAEIKVNILPMYNQIRSWRRLNSEKFSLDIVTAGRKEFYQLDIREDMAKRVEFLPLEVRPKDRHLLLMSKQYGETKQDTETNKFLCGHDERHWFVASVDATTRNVMDAMERLKPEAAIHSQRSKKVKRKNWNRRHNVGFIRQGEWFFIPRPEMEAVKPTFILKNEPLSRGAGSKPHMVEKVYRVGGTTVYVCSRFPNGIMQDAYSALIRKNRSARSWGWTVMARDPKVYAKGWVRHSDHKTLHLPIWHEVVMNQEATSEFVAFLD